MIFPFNIIISYNEYIVNCFDMIMTNFVLSLSHLHKFMTKFIPNLSHLARIMTNFVPFLSHLQKFMTNLSPICHILRNFVQVLSHFLNFIHFLCIKCIFWRFVTFSAPQKPSNTKGFHVWSKICHIFSNFVPSLSRVCHVHKQRGYAVYT